MAWLATGVWRPALPAPPAVPRHRISREKEAVYRTKLVLPEEITKERAEDLLQDKKFANWVLKIEVPEPEGTRGPAVQAELC